MKDEEHEQTLINQPFFFKNRCFLWTRVHRLENAVLHLLANRTTDDTFYHLNLLLFPANLFFFLKTELAGIDHPPKRAHSGYYFRQKIAIPQANEFCCVEPLYITASTY